MTYTKRYYLIRAIVRTMVVAIPLIGGFAWALSPAYTLCATEDSTNCVWNANVQGNGTAYYFGIGE